MGIMGFGHRYKMSHHWYKGSYMMDIKEADSWE